MFECLRRRHRHLRTWVLGLFAALWLVALSSAAPTRMVLPVLAHRAQASFSMAALGFFRVRRLLYTPDPADAALLQVLACARVFSTRDDAC